MQTIIISVFFTIISYKLFRKAAGSMALSRLNIISVIFYLNLIGMCYIGLTLARIGVENYALRKAEIESLNKAYWSVSYVLLIMPLSMIFYQKYLFKGNIKLKLESFYSSNLIPLQSKLDSAQLFFWSLMTIIITFAALYSFSFLPKLPIIAILTNASSSTIGHLRFTAKFGFSGNVYLRNLLFLNIAPLISFIAYGYKRIYKKNIKIKLWFYYTLFLAFLAVTFDGEKAPLLVYIVTLAIVKSIIDGGITKKQMIILSILGSGVIMLLYALIDKNITVFSLYGGIGSRLLMVPSAGLVNTFEIFPSQHAFLHGASLPGWMIAPFGMEHERSARVVMGIINPEGIIAETAGVQNSIYIAEAFANFGLIGLLISPLIVGFVIQFIYNLILSRPKSPVYVAVFAVFFFKFPVMGGFVDFIWNIGWIMLLFIIVLSISTRKNIKILTQDL